MGAAALDPGVSILIFLDSSFLYMNQVNFNCHNSPSQSLFSWIHLSYRLIGIRLNGKISIRLNPYFPGFIFLICKARKGGKGLLEDVSILIFLDSSFLYTNAQKERKKMKEVSILIFLDSSFLCK